eukprot:CAMPEP_0116845420 /NCGR_PEP_ID=MMETSP0418-20121206/13256_1 /TAXON_ID=1158023 /ORGANISM="Astrosyne radiata, Strain 13vi08-1A" /LENGTH=206 /DNA_ID=CAMNT_0004476527 /DNA_START=551 /DNA_END=1171 /DNA_ORIENTATION=+
MTILVALLQIGVLLRGVESFPVVGGRGVSRRQLLKRVTGWTATTIVGAPFLVNAEDSITDEVARSTALQKMKRIQKEILKLEKYVVDSDYDGLRQALRVAPIADVRKVCSKLIRSEEEGPNYDSWSGAYKDFISALEKLDANAALASKGRTITEEKFSGSFNDTVSTYGSFVTAVENVVADTVGAPPDEKSVSVPSETAVDASGAA